MEGHEIKLRALCAGWRPLYMRVIAFWHRLAHTESNCGRIERVTRRGMRTTWTS
jgi:hypothetical protein